MDNKYMNEEIKNQLKNKIEKIHSFLYKEYIANLKTDYSILIPKEKEDEFDRNNVPHCFKITRLVERRERDKDEELLSDKFKNIFAAFNNTGATIALFAVKKDNNFEFYFFVKSKEIKYSEQDRNLFIEILKSNFNGTEVDIFEPKGWYEYKNTSSEELNLDNLINDTSGSIACVSAVATEKSEKFISQGLEKLFDTPNTEDFEILILAQSLTHEDVRLAKIGYENLATEIAPLATIQEANGKSFAESIGKSDTEGKSHTHGINESISNTIGGSVAVTTGTSATVNGGVNIGPVNAGASLSVNVSGTVSADYHHTKTKGFSDSDTTSSSVTSTKSTIDTITDTTTLTYTDYLIKDSLNKIEEQVKRLDIGKSVGLWKTATYIHSSHGSAVTRKLANIYKGLIQGDKSYIEPCVVTEWTYDEKDKSYSSIVKYLKKFEHPLLVHIEDLNQSKNEFENKINAKENQISVVTPAIFVNTSELAQQMCCPRKSVPGLPVFKCAEFAREIISFDHQDDGKALNLGKVFHMHHKENQEVKLDSKSLCSHTFITGSTGSGKSNTVYQMLSEIKKTKVNFLVVEPAKGEYKHVFGQNENNDDCDVHVYGTNPSISNLLRINPFSFPNGNDDVTKNIHILEHLDRLVEIFNVCWPMYAAMPAVLKEAVEKSYEDCGWNLTESSNKYGKDLYPTFADVTRNIRTIIDSSEYDAENKGAYKGALITRLKSLSNGINGLVFTTDELSDEDLFDKNVIVDLSRVGSPETKSLIMGLLVLKLQEHRMTSGEMNASLKHVTVLEEAHNLLKRTSTEQSQDSGNLLGKSVEMLTNAIAEMRTYGEGFIIADQAPGLLDMAVIRNTNTKIIMRLPDLGDRELVGKAANLNDNQIEELAKLPTGVAAVYQNNWIQPVLCKVDKVEQPSNIKYEKKKENNTEKKEFSESQKIDIAKLLFYGTALPSSFVKELSKYNISGRSMKIIIDINDKVEHKKFDKQDTENSVVLSELYSDISDTMLQISNKTTNFDELLIAYEPLLANVIKDEELRKGIFTTLIVNLFINEMHNSEMLEKWKNQYMVR